MCCVLYVCRVQRIGASVYCVPPTLVKYPHTVLLINPLHTHLVVALAHAAKQAAAERLDVRRQQGGVASGQQRLDERERLDFEGRGGGRLVAERREDT